jgi:Flp pilus assembly protein TadD
MLMVDPDNHPAGPAEGPGLEPNPDSDGREPARFHRRAIQLHRDGDSGKAISMMRRAVVENPDNFRTTTDFYTLSRWARETVTIDVWTRRVLALLPTHAPALRHHARRLVGLGGPRAASRVLNRVLLCIPDNGNDWVSLATAATSTRSIDDCLRYLTRATCTAPASPSIRFALGCGLFNARRFVEAESQMKIVIDSGRDDPQVLFWMGRILHAQQRRAEARNFLARAAKTGAEMARLSRMIEATVLASDFVDPVPTSL